MRVMVDMSATLVHNGHIRLLRFAKQFGEVIVGLATDDEIERHKGYVPEINYSQRKEVIEAIRYVDEVIPSPWLIEESFLDQHHIDKLVHGADNSNPISQNRLIIIPRTEGISSTDLRWRAQRVVIQLGLDTGSVAL